MKHPRAAIFWISLITALSCVVIEGRVIDTAKIREPNFEADVASPIQDTEANDEEEETVQEDLFSDNEIDAVIVKEEILTTPKVEITTTPKVDTVWEEEDALVAAMNKPTVRPAVSTYRPENRQTFPTRVSADEETEQLEITTKYKYEKEILPFIVTQKYPLAVPIRHAAGTYWMPVDQNRDLTEQLLETQRNVFDKPFSSAPRSEPRPANEPPPKY